MFEKCPKCGRFCGISLRRKGDLGYCEVPSCLYCGVNVPNCVYETGSVFGCRNNATHEMPGRKYRKYYCRQHAPSDAKVLPYMRKQ